MDIEASQINLRQSSMTHSCVTFFDSQSYFETSKFVVIIIIGLPSNILLR